MACYSIDHWSRIAALAVCLGAAVPAQAETLDYSLEIAARQSVTYSVDFDVVHPGQLAIDIEWIGTRVVSFRLNGPEPMGTLLRRSGPSPQRLEILVDDETARLAGTWTLSIRALPAREPTDGTIHLHLPEPESGESTVAPVTPTPPRPIETEPWTIPRSPSVRAPADRVRVFQAIERFRRLVIEDPDAPPDGYVWQREFLRYAAERRDEMGQATDPNLSASTLEMLGRFARTIDSIELLRRSRDPLVNGPVPREAARLRAWQILHDERFSASGNQLDEILGGVVGGFAPELEREVWPVKFASCLIACQRYFAERPRLGAEAPNREVAEAQWERILSAGEVLHRLLETVPAP